MNEEFGLKDDWSSIQKTLEEIIPVYDKTNRYISLGTDLRLRRAGVELLQGTVGKKSFSVLDLGCGTGRMSKTVLEQNPEEIDSVLLVDPIDRMMKVARSRTGADGVTAVFENLPFKMEVFDSAMAGFSLRDARNMKKALQEINSLLKASGKFLIVDLSKPDSKFKASVIGLYWRISAPLIAFLVAGTAGLKFGGLAKTFRKLPKNSEFKKLVLDSGFQITEARYFMFGGASVLLLTKVLSSVG